MIQTEALTAEEWPSLKEAPSFIENHSEALLQYFGRSIKYTIFPVYMVIGAMATVLYADFQVNWVLLWLAAVAALQTPRLYLSRKMSNTQDSIKNRHFIARSLP